MLDLINNLALLLSLEIVSEVSITASKLKRVRPYFAGILIGLIGILIMSMPWHYSSGVIFDTRSILISVSALIYGAIPTILGSVIMAVYRILIEGTGWITGVVVIAVCSVAGLLWRKYVFRIDSKRRVPALFLFGFLIHVAVLCCMFLLPWPLSINIIRGIGAQITIIYTIGTVILSLLLIHQKERYEALTKISEAEVRYMSLFHNAPTIMLHVRPEDGLIVDANMAASTFYELPIEQLRNKKLSDFCMTPHARLIIQLKKALYGEQNFFTTKHRSASGSVVDVEVHSSPIRMQAETLLYLIVHNVSARIASQNALMESEARFRMLVENAPDAIFIQSRMKIAYANTRAVELFGASTVDDLIDTPVIERIHPDYRATIRQRIAALDDNDILPPLEERYLRLDGTSVAVEVTAFKIKYRGVDGAVVFSRDISERKINEMHLRNQQKLESIGLLAGGVAHEINNPINGIMNYAELISDDALPDTKIEKYAHEIINEGKRISQIVKNLLQFSRNEKLVYGAEDISEIIKKTLTLINTLINKDQIDFQVHIEEDLPNIRCNSQQIQQVIINLITNARDALNEKYEGYDPNKILSLSCTKLTAEEYVRLEILDHGKGITQEMSERIFEPFFSTKSKDKGTGLGLSISYGIIFDHHGIIKVESEIGKYTKFIVDLPVDPSMQGENYD